MWLYGVNWSLFKFCRYGSWLSWKAVVCHTASGAGGQGHPGATQPHKDGGNRIYQAYMLLSSKVLHAMYFFCVFITPHPYVTPLGEFKPVCYNKFSLSFFSQNLFSRMETAGWHWLKQNEVSLFTRNWEPFVCQLKHQLQIRSLGFRAPSDHLESLAAVLHRLSAHWWDTLDKSVCCID